MGLLDKLILILSFKGSRKLNYINIVMSIFLGLIERIAKISINIVKIS